MTYDKQTLRRGKYFSKIINLKLSKSEYLSDRKNSLEWSTVIISVNFEKSAVKTFRRAHYLYIRMPRLPWEFVSSRRRSLWWLAVVLPCPFLVKIYGALFSLINVTDAATNKWLLGADCHTHCSCVYAATVCMPGNPRFPETRLAIGHNLKSSMSCMNNGIINTSREYSRSDSNT